MHSTQVSHQVAPAGVPAPCRPSRLAAARRGGHGGGMHQQDRGAAADRSIRTRPVRHRDGEPGHSRSRRPLAVADHHHDTRTRRLAGARRAVHVGHQVRDGARPGDHGHRSVVVEAAGDRQRRSSGSHLHRARFSDEREQRCDGDGQNLRRPDRQRLRERRGAHGGYPPASARRDSAAVRFAGSEFHDVAERCG